tara:strand:- start:188 stop:523 length:336 start_codon:yes stop_codon:yes gene_type:complete
MEDTIDVVLDWLDGILPPTVLLFKDVSRDMRDEDSRLRKIINFCVLIIKTIFVLVSLYTVYHVKVVQGRKYFEVDIRVKAITSIFNLIVILYSLYILSKELFFTKKKSTSK